MKTDVTPFSRPTSYRGVMMRSRLEAAWAEQFDALGWEWEYEPICLAGTEGQYLPDFSVHRPNDKRTMYWEIKGGWWQSTENRTGEEMLESNYADIARMFSLIKSHDDQAPFVLAYQPCWADTHVIDVRWRSEIMHNVNICRCPEGCGPTLVEKAGTYCPSHHHDWQPIQLVASLHNQQWPSDDLFRFDKMASILGWTTQ